MANRCPRVAVVDDEADVLRAMQRLLRAAGFEVEIYASGEAFLDALANRCPDCLVLDLHMPGISGFEVQARLKACNCGIPVIVITGHDTASAESLAIQGGAFAFLRKPADGDVVVSTIERAINAGTG
jgi:FixJ family two-component response regulator